MLRLYNDPLIQRGVEGSGVVPRAPNYEGKNLRIRE
jgi:hypothetical protein